MKATNHRVGRGVLVLGVVALLAPAHAWGWQTEWLTTIGGSADSGAASVALTSSGDVVTAGSISARGDASFGVALLDGPTGVQRWRYTSDEGAALDLSLVGDQVIAAGNVQRIVLSSFDFRFGTTINLNVDTGLPVWENAQRIDQNSGDMLSAADAGFTPGGAPGVDVATAGQVRPSSPYATRQFHVDLRRSTGLVWETYIAPFQDFPYQGPGAARDVALHLSGDVIAAGEVQEIIATPYGGTTGGRHLAVARLARDTGAVVWLHVVTEYSGAYRLAFDSAGDIVVVGHIAQAGASGSSPDFLPKDMIALKLAAGDGAEIWRTVIDSGVGGITDVATDLAIDASDDVILGGKLQTTIIDPYWDPLIGSGVYELSVVKLSGGTGAELWRRLVPNSVATVGNPVAPGVQGRAESVAVSADGSVVAAGTVDGDPVGSGVTGHIGTFTVLRLDGATGDVQWLQPLLEGNARDVAIAADESIVAAGRKYQYDPGDNDRHDLVVVKFSDRVGAASLKLRDSATPQARRLDIASNDSLVHAPVAGSVADPTKAGARLIVTDVTTGEATFYDLPAQYWSARGRGYKYLDRDGAAGPCSKVQLRQGRLKVKCRGAGIDTRAARGNGSRVAAKLELGPAQTVRYCMEFGDTVLTDEPGRFEANEASAPAACTGS